MNADAKKPANDDEMISKDYELIRLIEKDYEIFRRNNNHVYVI